MPTIVGIEVPVEAMETRDLVTPSGTAAEQAAVETLLILASLPWVGGSWDQVLSLGATTKWGLDLRA